MAFASGTEPASSSLIGPGLDGLIVIIPSIPDSPPDGVCPVQEHTSMKTSPKMMENVRILTHKFRRRDINWQGKGFVEAF